ncbi:uncharacterized protein LOC141634341 [Silene latifolia]|uniref:uncharacterized protein LOC141634341 n=1 Tax=Silene latifolia TaxID=37657 RepID=UPI003D76FCCA
MVCLTSPYYSLSINGGVEGFFPGKKGLRQGDPLSPYLFVICMEVLSRLLRKLPRYDGFSYHPKCVQLNLTHLVFADDLLVFTRGDLPSLQAVAQCLAKFDLLSGLQANPAKTSLYFGGVASDVRSLILAATGFNEGEFPFRYLGLSLFNSRISNAMYQPLMDKIKSKISHWTNKTLSYAGAIGIKEILSWNCAQMMKWVWKLLYRPQSIWSKWVHHYILKGGDIWQATTSISHSWYWNNVVKMKDLLISNAGSVSSAAEWITNCSGSANFHTGQMYSMLRQPADLVSWGALVHHNACVPKHAFLGLMVMENKLPTVDNLIQRGLHLVNRCVLCCCQNESLEHLYFQCPFSTQVWLSIASWLQVCSSTSLELVISWFLSCIPGKGLSNSRKRVGLMATLYYIWRERNGRIFNGMHHTTDFLCTQIKFVVCNRVA